MSTIKEIRETFKDDVVMSTIINSRVDKGDTPLEVLEYIKTFVNKVLL